MAILALILVGPAVLVVVLVAYVALLKTRHHYTSRLTCPRCGRPFDYQWVPLASFSAVRLGTSRYLQCPVCHEWSTFNIWDTRVVNPERSELASSE